MNPPLSPSALADLWANHVPRAKGITVDGCARSVGKIRSEGYSYWCDFALRAFESDPTTLAYWVLDAQGAPKGRMLVSWATAYGGESGFDEYVGIPFSPESSQVMVQCFEKEVLGPRGLSFSAPSFGIFDAWPLSSRWPRGDQTREESRERRQPPDGAFLQITWSDPQPLGMHLYQVYWLYEIHLFAHLDDAALLLLTHPDCWIVQASDRREPDTMRRFGPFLARKDAIAKACLLVAENVIEFGGRGISIELAMERWRYSGTTVAIKHQDGSELRFDAETFARRVAQKAKRYRENRNSNSKLNRIGVLLSEAAARDPALHGSDPKAPPTAFARIRQILEKILHRKG